MIHYGQNTESNKDNQSDESMSILDAIAVLIGAGLAFIALFVGLAVLNAWVLSTLWAWYVVTAFNLPKLSIIHAFGISLIWNYLTYKPITDTKKISGTQATVALLMPFLALVLGWIGTFFM